jgi:predicted dehydrogenase
VTTLLPPQVGRRTLLKQGAALLAAPWIITSRAAGAAPPSERVTVGFIGVGMMGRAHLRRMASHPDVRVLAVCDVDQWRLKDAQAQVDAAYAADQKSGTYKGCSAYTDFRELLGRDDIDAVIIASGDRWHAVHTVMAARAGKDIYCEKPASLTIHESRAIVNAVNRYGRVYQGGFQQRSVRDFQTAVHLIHGGRLGRLKTIYCNWVGTSGFVNLPAEPVPPTLDWDLWVGPAVWHPFNNRFHRLGEPNRTVPWDFNRDFAGGSITSNGVHHLDIAQWALGMDESGPVEIIPPTHPSTVVTYKYASGVTVQSFPHRLDPKTQEVPEGFDPTMRFMWEVLFIGEHGWILAGRQGPLKAHPAEILADPWGSDGPTSASAASPAAISTATPVARPPDGRTGPTPPRELAEQLYRARGYGHHDNWIQAIRMRQQPISSVESAARSTNVAHVANIATWTGRTQKWDPLAEAFIDDDEANRMRQRPLREPWTL